MSIIQAIALSKIYQHKKEQISVLSNLSFSITKGSAFAITGESGCGKTTLLYILSGLDTASSGDIFINEKNISSLSEEDLANFRVNMFGFIFQHHFLLDNLNAFDNSILPLRISKNLSKNSLDRIHFLFDKLGLSDRKNHMPDELSGGEKQRVAVIRALANDPAIIFADEPTGSLDKKNGEILAEMLLTMVQEENKTLVLSTHNIHFASLCNVVKSINELGDL